MAYVWVHNHKGMSENLVGFKGDEEGTQLYLTCPDSRQVMAHVYLLSSGPHTAMEHWRGTHPNPAATTQHSHKPTVTSPAAEAFLADDLTAMTCSHYENLSAARLML